MDDPRTVNQVYFFRWNNESGMHLLYAGYVVYRPEGCIQRHTHGHYEIGLVTEGSIKMTVGNQVCSIHPGDLLITKPGDFHSVRSLGDQWGMLYIGVGRIVPDEIDGVFRHCSRNVFTNAESLEEPFRRIVAETKERRFGMAVAIEGQLMQLMVAIARIIEPGKDSRERPMPRPVAQARVFLDSNPYHDVSLADVASYSCLSRSRLSCLFSREMGMSLRDYLRYVIMQRSLRLLEDDRKSISDIAGELRYPSVQYFSTVFHKFWGYTPTEYRAALRNHIPHPR